MTQKELANLIGKTVSFLALLDIPHLTYLAQKLLSESSTEFADFILNIADLQLDKKYTKSQQVEIYCQLLNENGQEKLLEYAKLLYNSDNYRLEDTSPQE